MAKKKIAMCISGYLRTFEECYPSILKNIIQDNDIDIFIHTYDKLGNSSGWRHPIDLSEDINMEFLESIPNIKVIAVQKWDNIKYQFEKFRQFVPNCSNINVIATIFYKIYMCNQLRKEYEEKNNIKYDLIIRMRGDQVFEKPINLIFPEHKILINAYPWGDEDFIHHFVGEDCAQEGCRNETEWISDRFAAGNSENIDYLCDLYNHFEELVANEPYVELEHLLYKHLINNNIELEKRNLQFYVKHKPPRLIKPI
jgi:hypothetical protein